MALFGRGEKDKDAEVKRPILENSSQGAAAWLHRDKNGNAYISVRLPLNLGNLNLFPTNDTIEELLNQFADLVEEEVEEE